MKRRRYYVEDKPKFPDAADLSESEIVSNYVALRRRADRHEYLNSDEGKFLRALKREHNRRIEEQFAESGADETERLPLWHRIREQEPNFNEQFAYLQIERERVYFKDDRRVSFRLCRYHAARHPERDEFTLTLDLPETDVCATCLDEFIALVNAACASPMTDPRNINNNAPHEF